MMNTPNPSQPVGERPTPDDLAGIPATYEEGARMIRVRRAVTRAASVRSRGKLNTKKLSGPPTAEDLAGVPITVEGKEDFTVRPWKRCGKK
jgi:hypothetical protein